MFYERSGYNLIELLVAISIILLILGFSFSGYARLARRQKITSAGQNLKNMLRDVQSRVYNGEVDCTVCDCSPSSGVLSEGWFVDFADKIYYGFCKGASFSVKPFNLSAETVISASSQILHFRSNPQGVNHDATICVSILNQENSFYIIQVSKSGEISDTGNIESSCPI